MKNILLGRPEWGQPDDEAADEYAASFQPPGVVENDESAARAAAQERRAEWRAAAAYYWATAYAALTIRDFRAMRQNAALASDAETRGGPDGVLLAAIFGGCDKRPPETAVVAGRKLSEDLVRAGRAAVLTEIKQHRKRKSSNQARKFRRQDEPM